MRQLKVCLWVVGVVCLPSVLGIFLPLSWMESFARTFGCPEFPDAPLFAYGLRVMSATYFAIGVFYIILALCPMRYGVLVPFSGLAGILVGTACLVSGIRLGLPAIVYLFDALFFLLFGVLIVVFWLRSGAAEGRAEAAQPGQGE